MKPILNFFVGCVVAAAMLVVMGAMAGLVAIGYRTVVSFLS